MKINIEEDINYLDYKLYKRMTILYNAINDGWSVKKKNDSYVFTKKHEGKEEIYLENYLENFLKTNMTLK